MSDCLRVLLLLRHTLLEYHGIIPQNSYIFYSITTTHQACNRPNASSSDPVQSFLSWPRAYPFDCCHISQQSNQMIFIHCILFFNFLRRSSTTYKRKWLGTSIQIDSMFSLLYPYQLKTQCIIFHTVYTFFSLKHISFSCSLLYLHCLAWDINKFKSLSHRQRQLNH